MPYVRTVKTKSGATAVQLVWSSQRGSREIEHLGSAHDEAGLEMLKAAGRQRIAAGQAELDLGLEPAGGRPLPVTSSRMGCLLDALERGYRVLGLDAAAGGDGVFRDLVLARIIEPVSKLDSLRVLEEAGVAPVSYRTAGRRLPAYAQDAWRQRLSAACAAHARLGPASLVLYDVSTLYFETGQGDGFREPGFSRERRLEPQITPLIPARVLALASSSRLTLFTAPSRAMNRFRLTGASPATACAALATCSSIPCSVRRARPALYW